MAAISRTYNKNGFNIMCGIYGITEHNPEFIHKYIQTCKHRGPDGERVWWDPDHKLTLGHNLLSIMSDPKLSAQPWKTPAGNWLVYNGEIFNYYELKDKYKDKGFAGITGCDTELLAWGLDTFGLGFIDEIDSMHGFAYYKVKDQQLWLSRDHAGIKPLYYAEVKQGLVFGSEVKGMLEMVPGSNKIDPLAVGCMTMTGVNALRNTFYSGIKKLLAGETVVYDISKKQITKRIRFNIKSNSNKSFNAEEFRQVANKTVQMCSIGRRKIGVFLSGGLDSSLVAYELKKVKGEANTFTNKMYPNVIVAGEDHNEDAVCAMELARKENFNHKEVAITPETIDSIWNDSVYYIEEPVYNPSIAMYCYTNKILHQNDIVVTMAGDMGDEVLGGYPKYWKMRNPEWLQKQIDKPKIDCWKDIVHLWTKRIKRPIQLYEGTIGKHTLIEELLKCYSDDLYNGDDPIGSYMSLDCVSQAPEEFFNRNDKFGMAYGMEGRFPLATKTFMKYCMNIHTDEKIGMDKSDTKMLTKIAYKNLLPNSIITKRKTGWTVPLQSWWKKESKADIPTMILNSWKQRYNILEH